VFPNPVRDGLLRVAGITGRVREVVVYDAGGREVARPLLTSGTLTIPMHGRPGTYLVVLRTDERSFVERVVVQ